MFHSCENEVSGSSGESQKAISKASSRHQSKKKAATKWTRVFTVQQLENVGCCVHSFEEDLNNMLLVYQDKEEEEVPELEPLFDAKAFNLLHGPLEIEAYRLKESELLRWAEIATTVRSDLFDRAVVAEKNSRLDAAASSQGKSVLQSLVQRRFSRQQKKGFMKELLLQGLTDDDRRRTKTRKLCELEPSDVVDILHSVFIGKLGYSESAQQHAVKLSLVQRLASKAKREPGFMRALYEKQEAQELKVQAVLKEAGRKLEAGVLIETVESLRWQVNHQHDLEMTRAQVYQVLRSRSTLKSAKICRVPIQANSQRCLV